VNEKTLDRYLKVKALAVGGEGGEKESAKRILRDFEAKHPGIREAAAAHARKQTAPPPRTRPQAPSRRGNWENIFRYAAGFYETVRDVVDDVTDAYYGKELAENEVEASGSSRNEAIFVRLKFPFWVVEEIRALNAVQKEAFRQAIHEKVETYLDAIVEDPK
jgi:hypothetical protein